MKINQIFVPAFSGMQKFETAFIVQCNYRIPKKICFYLLLEEPGFNNENIVAVFRVTQKKPVLIIHDAHTLQFLDSLS